MPAEPDLHPTTALTHLPSLFNKPKEQALKRGVGGQQRVAGAKTVLLYDAGMPQVTRGFRSTSLSPDTTVIMDKQSHLHVICNIYLSLTDGKVSCLASTFKTSGSWEGFQSLCVWGTYGARGGGIH